MEASAQLVKMEEEEPEDVEECEDGEMKDESKMACENLGATYISKTKNYVAYSKDGEIYACKFEIKDGKVFLAEEKQKVDKVFATFITGGSVTKDDTLPMPAILVEMTKGIMEKELGISNKFSAKDSLIAEKETKITELSAQSEKYKKYVSEYIPKFDEIVGKEQISKEFKTEILNKIYDMKFANSEEMETKIQSYLYQIHKAEILGGTFPSANKQEKIKDSCDYNSIIKKYK
jgi:hypothetical protein